MGEQDCAQQAQLDAARSLFSYRASEAPAAEEQAVESLAALGLMWLRGLDKLSDDRLQQLLTLEIEALLCRLAGRCAATSEAVEKFLQGVSRTVERSRAEGGAEVF